MKTLSIISVLTISLLQSSVLLGDFPVTYKFFTHPTIAIKSKKQEDSLAEDVRREWPINTAEMGKISGNGKIIIQCGFLSNRLIPGSIILILDKDDSTFDVLVKPRWGTRLDLAKIDQEKLPDRNKHLAKMVEWGSSLENSSSRLFRKATKIPGNFSYSDGGDILFFVAEITDTDTNVTIQHAGSYKKLLPPDEQLSLLFLWTLHHANAWTIEAIEEYFVTEFDPLPLLGDFNFPPNK